MLLYLVTGLEVNYRTPCDKIAQQVRISSLQKVMIFLLKGGFNNSFQLLSSKYKFHASENTENQIIGVIHSHVNTSVDYFDPPRIIIKIQFSRFCTLTFWLTLTLPSGSVGKLYFPYIYFPGNKRG